MDKILLTTIILVGLIISGCGTVNMNFLTVGVFHNITEKHKGAKVVVLPFKKELENSKLNVVTGKKNLKNLTLT